MLRTSCCILVFLGTFVLASSAMGATISIAPTSGPAGTVVTFQGVVTECSDEAAQDVEVTAGTSRQLAELDDAGAVSGTMTMRGPSPLASASVQVRMRCIDSNGTPDGDDITPEPATFTYTSAQPAGVGSGVAAGDAAGVGAPAGASPAPCATLASTRPDVPLDVLLGTLDACLQVVLRGTGLANTIFGNVLANVIDGFGGNDVLRGLAGNDVIRGGAGNDRTVGDAGNDHLFGNAGADVLVGGAGGDALTGGAGHDSMQGGGGPDTLVATDGTADDTVDGGPGTDRCTVDRGDVVHGCEHVTTR